MNFYPAGHAALRPERALDPGRDAKCRRAYLGGLADQYPDAGPGIPAAEIVDLRELDRDSDRVKTAPPLPLAGEGWGGGVAANPLVLWRELPHPDRILTRSDLRASFARLDPRKRER